jgi:hypothetical protein
VPDVGDVEDLLRECFERHGLLVSPSFLVDERLAFFVYSPEGFDRTMHILKTAQGVTSIDRTRNMAAANAWFAEVKVSFSETWEPWVTALFPLVEPSP